MYTYKLQICTVTLQIWSISMLKLLSEVKNKNRLWFLIRAVVLQQFLVLSSAPKKLAESIWITIFNLSNQQQERCFSAILRIINVRAQIRKDVNFLKVTKKVVRTMDILSETRFTLVKLIIPVKIISNIHSAV